MKWPNQNLSASDTWPDFELSQIYPVDLDGLTEAERQAAVNAIEEMIRPFRESRESKDAKLPRKAPPDETLPGN